EAHGATHAILTGVARYEAERELRSALGRLREQGHGRHGLLAYPSGAHDPGAGFSAAFGARECERRPLCTAAYRRARRRLADAGRVPAHGLEIFVSAGLWSGPRNLDQEPETSPCRSHSGSSWRSSRVAPAAPRTWY